ncbi:MAG: zf-HC2 domain-containing protein [Acidobacteriota bacterium]|nr:zf-HC2 domain-containing protein [Acidobacteriota bacterium]
MMTPCREIARILLSDEIASQPIWRRMEIRMHLAMCRFCSRLARQITQMGEAFRRSIEEDPAATGLESRLLERLQGL